MEDDKKLTCDLEIEKSIDFEYFVTLFDPVRCEIMKCLAIHGTLNIKEISAYFTQDRSVLNGLQLTFTIVHIPFISLGFEVVAVGTLGCLVQVDPPVFESQLA